MLNCNLRVSINYVNYCHPFEVNKCSHLDSGDDLQRNSSDENVPVNDCKDSTAKVEKYNFLLNKCLFLFSQVNSHFMKKIPKGAEASNILVGEVNFLEKSFSAFIRLQEAAILGDLTEVPVPTRFLFIMLGPCVRK